MSKLMVCYKGGHNSIFQERTDNLMKNKILNMLLDHQDQYLSGEEISARLGVSRTAIWKHIKSLKTEGYEIHSVTNKGYRLISSTKEINSTSLKSMVEPFKKLQFSEYYQEIDSTNQEAKRIALTNSIIEGIVVSAEQTAGKGRLGRNWTSEKNAGLWMSLLLRPAILPEQASGITLVAAAAMCQAIEKTTGLLVGIKWPNDLIINQKKICGILTEMSAEINHLHYVILGIGVNLRQREFNEELADKATSLLLEGVNIDINQLLPAFLDSFFDYYESFEQGVMDPVIEYHKTHSLTLNREVVILQKNDIRHVYAVDLNQNGSLVIVNENNMKESIISGEVSVRGINGYI